MADGHKLNANKVNVGQHATSAYIGALTSEEQYITVSVVSPLGNYVLYTTENGISLWDEVQEKIIWSIHPTT